MATQHRTAVRTVSEQSDVRDVLLAVAYGAGIIATIAAATGAAFVITGLTTGLGSFVVVAGGWLAVVSASPEIAGRLTQRLDRIELGQRAPRTSRAVHSAVAYLVAN